MSDRKLLSVGLTGTVIAGICCFTPALLILFGFVGLSALTPYLDLVLFPTLGIFLIITITALIRRARRN